MKDIIFKTLMLKGEAGSTIVSMEKTGHAGTIDTYTITFDDGSTTDIYITNLSSVDAVELTSQTDTEDTYTVTLSDGSTQSFSVLNHNADIEAISEELAAGLASIEADLNDQAALLSARMDTFTSLPSGSTAGDAELMDIRVGANGKTYDSAGSAVRGQVNDLKSSMIDGVITLSEYNSPGFWQLGGINGTSGQNENNSVRCRSLVDHALYAKKDCIIKTSKTDFYLFIFQYNDSSCTDFEGELGYIGGGTLEKTLPAGYYYRFRAQMAPPVSITDSVISELIAKFTIEEDTVIAENNKKLEDLEENVTQNAADIADLKDRYYLEYGINRNSENDIKGWIDSDGSIKTTGSYWTTDFCYVGDLDSVICSCNAVGGTVRYAQDMAFLATYDSDKNFIERVYTTGQPTYTVEEGVEYIRFCIEPTYIENVMLQGGTTFSTIFIAYADPEWKLKPQYYVSGSNWSDKKWVAVGDSLTEANAKTDLNYHDYIRQATGINVINMGSSGTGYKRSEGESKAFYQRILNAPTDADVVTIFGSGNDLNYAAMGFNNFADALGSPTDTGTSTICGCINQTIDNLYSIMPTVQLGIVTPNPWENMNPANTGNDMDLYSEAIIQICKLRGIPCLDLYHCSNMRPWDSTYKTLCYSKDDGYGVHPDETGHKILASHFKAFLSTLII